MIFIKTSSKIIRLIRSGGLLFVGVLSLFFLPDIKENTPNTAYADFVLPGPIDGSASSASASCGGCSCAGSF